MSDSDAVTTSASDPALPGAESLILAPSEASEKERRRQESMRFYGATTLAEFAGRFGLVGIDPEKTLKRWIDKGRGVSPHDLPPYQAPHELAAWWRRMQAAGIMGKKPPEWMSLLEQAGPHAQTPASGASAPSPPPGTLAAASDAPTAKAAPIADYTPEFALPTLDADASAGEKQLLEFAQGWLSEMESAKKARDSKRFYRAWGEYKSLTKELRAWQKDRLRERVQNREVMEVEKEQAALGVIFGSMGKTFLSALDVVFAKCRPDLDATARRAHVQTYKDKIFSALKGTRFQTAVPHEELDRFLAA